MGNSQDKPAKPLRKAISVPNTQDLPPDAPVLVREKSRSSQRLYQPKSSKAGKAGKKSKHSRDNVAAEPEPQIPYTEAVFLPEFPLRGDVEDVDYDVIDVIAKGAYGNVIKVQREDEKRFYAVKVLDKAQILHDGAISQCKDEASIQSMAGHHPFVVKAYEYWQSHHNLYIVLDYIPHGDMFTLWTFHGCFPEELVRLYIAEMAMVIEFLHESSVIYRDVKMENILFDPRGHIQLTDFGLAKRLQRGDNTRTVCGTLQYMAPEVLSVYPYGHPADWWSVGILMYAMLVGKYPVDGVETHTRMAQKVFECDYLLPGHISNSSQDVINRILTKSPHKRLCDLDTIQDLHFFQELIFTDLIDNRINPVDVVPPDFFPMTGVSWAPQLLTREDQMQFDEFDDTNRAVVGAVHHPDDSQQRYSDNYDDYYRQSSGGYDDRQNPQHSDGYDHDSYERRQHHHDRADRQGSSSEQQRHSSHGDARRQQHENVKSHHQQKQHNHSDSSYDSFQQRRESENSNSHHRRKHQQQNQHDERSRYSDGYDSHHHQQHSRDSDSYDSRNRQEHGRDGHGYSDSYDSYRRDDRYPDDYQPHEPNHRHSQNSNHQARDYSENGYTTDPQERQQPQQQPPQQHRRTHFDDVQQRDQKYTEEKHFSKVPTNNGSHLLYRPSLRKSLDHDAMDHQQNTRISSQNAPPHHRERFGSNASARSGGAAYNQYDPTSRESRASPPSYMAPSQSFGQEVSRDRSQSGSVAELPSIPGVYMSMDSRLSGSISQPSGLRDLGSTPAGAGRFLSEDSVYVAPSLPKNPPPATLSSASSSAPPPLTSTPSSKLVEPAPTVTLPTASSGPQRNSVGGLNNSLSVYTDVKGRTKVRTQPPPSSFASSAIPPAAAASSNNEYRRSNEAQVLLPTSPVIKSPPPPPAAHLKPTFTMATTANQNPQWKVPPPPPLKPKPAIAAKPQVRPPTIAPVPAVRKSFNAKKKYTPGTDNNISAATQQVSSNNVYDDESSAVVSPGDGDNKPRPVPKPRHNVAVKPTSAAISDENSNHVVAARPAQLNYTPYPSGFSQNQEGSGLNPTSPDIDDSCQWRLPNSHVPSYV